MAPSKGAYTGLPVCMLFTLWAALTRVGMPNSQIPLLDPGAYNFLWMPMTIGMIGHVLVLGVGYAASRGTDGADFRRSLGRPGRCWLILPRRRQLVGRASRPRSRVTA